MTCTYCACPGLADGRPKCWPGTTSACHACAPSCSSVACASENHSEVVLAASFQIFFGASPLYPCSLLGAPGRTLRTERTRKVTRCPRHGRVLGAVAPCRKRPSKARCRPSLRRRPICNVWDPHFATWLLLSDSGKRKMHVNCKLTCWILLAIPTTSSTPQNFASPSALWGLQRKQLPIPWWHHRAPGAAARGRQHHIFARALHRGQHVQGQCTSAESARSTVAWRAAHQPVKKHQNCRVDAGSGGLYFFKVPGPGCLTMGYASEVCFGGMLRGMLRLSRTSQPYINWTP